MNDTLQLETSLKKTGDSYQLRYTLRNPLPFDVLVYHGVVTMREGQAVVEPGAVYTLIDKDTLVLAKAVVEIPFGVQLEIADVPYATKLPSGESLSGTIPLSLPLDYYNPNDLVFETQEITCRALRLRLGWAPLADLDPPPKPVQVGGKNYYRVPYRSALASQRLVESKPFSLVIPVHKHP